MELEVKHTDTYSDSILRVEEQALLKVFEVYPLASLICDNNGIIIAFNQKAELIFGCDRADIVGHNVDILLPADVVVEHTSHIKRFFEDPKKRTMAPQSVLLRARKPLTGEVFPCNIELSPFTVPLAGTFVLVAVVRN